MVWNDGKTMYDTACAALNVLKSVLVIYHHVSIYYFRMIHVLCTTETKQWLLQW